MQDTVWYITYCHLICYAICLRSFSRRTNPENPVNQEHTEHGNPRDNKTNALFHVKQQSLEVLSFRMIDVHRVVAWLVQAIKNADSAAGLGCC